MYDCKENFVSKGIVGKFLPTMARVLNKSAIFGEYLAVSWKRYTKR